MTTSAHSTLPHSNHRSGRSFLPSAQGGSERFSLSFGGREGGTLLLLLLLHAGQNFLFFLLKVRHQIS